MEHGRCRKCGKRKSSKLSEGVTSNTFGRKVKSIIAAFSGFYKNSKREVAIANPRKVYLNTKRQNQ